MSVSSRLSGKEYPELGPFISDLQAGVNEDIETVAVPIRADIEQLKTRVTSVEGRVQTLETGVSTLNGQVAVLQTTTATLETTLTGVQASVATLQSSVSTLQGSVTTLQSNVSTLQSSVSTVQGSLSALQSTVSSLESAVSSLQSSATTEGGTTDGGTTSGGTTSTATYNVVARWTGGVGEPSIPITITVNGTSFTLERESSVAFIQQALSGARVTVSTPYRGIWAEGQINPVVVAFDATSYTFTISRDTTLTVSLQPQ
jgi:prefoldin subunit 5